MKKRKEEWLKTVTPIGKLMYYLGAVKITKKSWFLRILHPASWVVILIAFLTEGFNAETFEDCKRWLTWW